MALVGSLIERASSSDARRWALVRGWLIAEAIALAVVATVCLGRGRSESALAIIGWTVVWIGVGVLLLDKVQASSVVAPHGRAFCFRAVPRQGTPVHFRRARAWCLATVVVAVGPLQYAGATGRRPFSVQG